MLSPSGLLQRREPLDKRLWGWGCLPGTKPVLRPERKSQVQKTQYLANNLESPYSIVMPSVPKPLGDDSWSTIIERWIGINTYVVWNNKGGVGKSTITFNLSAGMRN